MLVEDRCKVEQMAGTREGIREGASKEAPRRTSKRIDQETHQKEPKKIHVLQASPKRGPRNFNLKIFK